MDIINLQGGIPAEGRRNGLHSRRDYTLLRAKPGYDATSALQLSEGQYASQYTVSIAVIFCKHFVTIEKMPA
jgi:hypothetical protein